MKHHRILPASATSGSITENGKSRTVPREQVRSWFTTPSVCSVQCVFLEVLSVADGGLMSVFKERGWLCKEQVTF